MQIAHEYPAEPVIALGAGRDLPVTGAVAQVYREAARERLAEENITAVVQRYFRR
jgi:hypothetical protein